MSKCSCKECDLEVFENSDKCILHCEKDDWRAKIPDKELEKIFSEKPILSAEYKIKLELFWNIFKQQITEDKVQNFNNIIFPTNAEFEIKELENKILKFNHCKFTDVFYFNFLNNVQRIEFDDCHFYKFVKFENIIFKEDFLFQNSTIYKDAELLFKDINFDGVVSFIKSTVETDFTFSQVRFNDMALFNNTIIGNLFFQNTFFRKESNFLDIKLSNVGSRETARIIKDSFEKENNIIEANKFYALEMKEREKELSPKKDFFEWLVFKIHGLSSNHSQDWTLALFWIINLTFFYSYLNTQPNDKILVFKIIFSFIAILIIACMTIKIPEENKEKRWLTTIPTTIVCYVFYGYLVETDWELSEFSKNLNPFSIMRGDEPITLGTLIFKIIIAYLIYQLIISIRQNTRRK